MKPMTHELRAKIQTHIKNRLDISDLIDGVDLTDMNLARAVIKRFSRHGEALTNVNFSSVEFGEKGGPPIDFSKCRLVNCVFEGAQFLTATYMRHTVAKGCNFSEAFLPYLEYQYATFLNCQWCETVLRMGSRLGLGARFDKNLFQELAKHWGIEVKVSGESVQETN